MVRKIGKLAKEAISSNKYKAGIREVVRYIKGSKLIIISTSLNEKDKQKLEEQAKSSNIPIYSFEGNSIQLAKLCGTPYRVTAIALKSGNSDEIESIFSEKNEPH